MSDAGLTAEEEDLVDQLFQLVQRFPSGIVADQLRKEFLNRGGRDMSSEEFCCLLRRAAEFEVVNHGSLLIIYPSANWTPQSPSADELPSRFAVDEMNNNSQPKNGVVGKKTDTSGQTMPANEPPIDELFHTAAVTCVVGLKDFAVQLVSQNRLRYELHEKLKVQFVTIRERCGSVIEFQMGEVDSGSSPVRAGALLGARLAGDQYHRVRVLSTERVTFERIERRHSADVGCVLIGMVEAEFVDHGDVDNVNVADLFVLSDELKSLYPPFAVRCCLEKFVSPSEEVSQLCSTNVERFKKAVFHDDGDGSVKPLSVQVRFELLPGFADRLLHTVDGRYMVTIKEGSNDATAKQVNDLTRKLRLTLSDENGIVTPLSVPLPRIPMTLGGGKKGGGHKKALEPTDVPRNRFDGRVVAAFDPHSFVLHKGGLEPLLEYTADLLEREVAKEKPLDWHQLKNKDLCAALISTSSRDGQQSEWCRASFVDSPVGGSHVRLFLVDYGSYRLVAPSALRRLPDAAYVNRHMMAVSCTLAGVSIPHPDRSWSKETQALFRERVTGKTFDVVVVSSESSSSAAAANESEVPLLSVRLADQAAKEDLAQWLINGGHAVAK